MQYMLEKHNIIGRKFGRLSVVSLTNKRQNRGRIFLCICDCGTSTEVLGTSLRRGLSKSCGCYSRQILSERKGNHGKTGTPEYYAWLDMRKRCLYKKHKNYNSYGGRGILICERWSDFKKFFVDMGNRPTSKHSLDRINNNGNYEPGNCRWATRYEQSFNRRNTIRFEYKGESKPLKEWCEFFGIDYKWANGRRRYNNPLNILGFNKEK